MNKILSIFMALALTITVLVTLYVGVTFQSVKQKHEHDVEMVDRFQIQPN